MALTAHKSTWLLHSDTEQSAWYLWSWYIHKLTYSAIEHQKWIDAMLLRQIQAEEQKCCKEHIQQVENKRSHEYQCNQMRDQIICDSPSEDRYTDDQRPGKCDCDERLENPRFIGFFQGQAYLNPSREAGSYYYTCATLAFKDPLTNQALEDETNLFNQWIWNQSPPKYPTYRDNQSASTPRMTRSHLENKVRNSNQSQAWPLTLLIPQIHLPEDPYQLQNENKVRTMDNVTNLDEAILMNHCWHY